MSNTLIKFAQVVTPAPADSYDNASLYDAEVKRQQEFQNSQQSWEDYRSAACQEVYYEFWGGSMADTARLGCMLEITQQRLKN